MQEICGIVSVATACDHLSKDGQRHQCSEFIHPNKGSKPAVGGELRERLLSDL
jgi:hypothetical protein